MIKDRLKDKIEQLSDDERRLLAIKVNELNINTQSFNTQKRIVAYIKGDSFLDKDDIKSYLKSKLPDYMIPSSIKILDDIPLLPNGKVDKKELLKIKDDVFYTEANSGEILNPENEIESKLVQIWEDVLGFSPISTNDNFFEIGGDSILSIQIVSKARKEGVNLKANQLFENQTIAKLSKELLKTSDVEKTHEHVTTIRKGGHKNPLFCIHSGGGHVFFYGLLKDHIKQDRPIYALQPSGINDDNEDMHLNVEKMSIDYLKTIREIQPHGPYNILVYCFSTSVGNEMSILLEGTGEKINIIVVDTMASAWNATDNDTFMARIKFFLKRIFTSPYATLKQYFQERYYLIEPYVVKYFGKEHEKKLERVKANLRKISLEYKWKKHTGQVSLILTNKNDKKFEEFIIQSWEKLALGGVNVLYTKGHHTTLFENPDIEYVSEQVDLAIED